ncbi:MFS transporter [Dictyobacter kobayashii]|uniref:Putative transporter YybO n=1 Tax=Dictyobacter kobayashii TaxID=2014872 RepID=A0A402AWA4_9CHLR|nr:MFS transporter [Dictyobacter kobayashii]GCE23376.1 putative transporter YybO [Dictyobacter kobayashii]
MQKRVGNVRWWMAILLGVGVVINYLDRVNLSVTTVSLQKEFHLSDAQIGYVLSSFLISYAVLQLPVGAWLDRFGVKWLIRIGSIIWTIATFLTAVVSGFGLILLCRLLLGIGEAPAFPGSSKATGYWFPVKERGLATSAFDAAAKFSSVIGAPLIAFVVTAYGWRAAFYVTALISLVYGIIFWLLYRDPSDSRQLSAEEAGYIKEGGAQEEKIVPAAGGWATFWYLFKQKKVWGLALGFAAYNYSFYLFLTWLPGYLQKTLHMSVLTSGWYTVIPWFIATLTDIFIGGVLVDRLIAQGHDNTRVRRTVVTIGMLLGLAVIGAAFTTDATVATIWISIALGGLAFAAPVAWSIPSLIAPKGTVGSVGSIMNLLGNLAGIAAPIVAGYILQATKSFAANFLVAGAILILGIISFLFLLGRIEQIPEPENLVEKVNVATGADDRSRVG